MAGPILGAAQTMKIATTASPTTTVGYLTEVDQTLENDVQDVTVAGDFWKDFLPGLNSGSASIKFFWAPEDSVQGVIRAAALARTLLYWEWKPDGGSNHYEGTMYIKSLKENSKPGSMVEADCSVQYTGQISFT